MPFGMKPPCAVSSEMPPCTPGQTPNANAVPAHRKATIAATLIEANQNSASPYERTDSRLTTVKRLTSASVYCQGASAGHQVPRIFAPATASRATTITQKYQYIQPVRKPASSP